MGKRSLRIEYGRHLVELGGRYPNMIVLEGDLKASTQSVQFQESFPERFFDIGVAEQNMVGIAAGLSREGKIPIVHSFACFISMRACEQVRTSVAYPRLNVKFVASHSGISSGSAGTTHHSTEDIAIMRSIANMVVLVPGDVEEMKQAVDAAFAYKGPVYIRLSAIEAMDVYSPEMKFSIGHATLMREGHDATIITTGTMVAEGLRAAENLADEKGLDVRVLQMASVKPIDTEAIISAARETRFIVTVEEHNVLGGLGGAICEVAAEVGTAKVIRIGIRDRFCGIGTASYLSEEEGLTASQVAKTIVQLRQGGLP